MVVGVEGEFDVGERFGGGEDSPVDGGKRRDFARPGGAFFSNDIKLWGFPVRSEQQLEAGNAPKALPVGHKS